MNFLSFLPFVQKAFQFLIDKYLKAKFPAYANLMEDADQVVEFAVEVVVAAQATGADGAAKKAAASKDLLAKLKAHGIDLPGDQDQAVCDMLVEVSVQGVKSFFKLA